MVLEREGGESVVLRGMVWEWMVLRGMVLRGMVLYKENDGGRMVWIGFAGWLVLGLVKKRRKKCWMVFFWFWFCFQTEEEEEDFRLF
jgi:hypothetical protein